jgi:hypothetical protein
MLNNKKLKLKDVITSSICTIVDRTCFFFNLGTWMGVVNFTAQPLDPRWKDPLYPLNRKIRGLYSRSETRFTSPCRESIPGSSSSYPIYILLEWKAKNALGTYFLTGPRSFEGEMNVVPMNFTVSPCISIHYLYMFQQMHLLYYNTNVSVNY